MSATRRTFFGALAAALGFAASSVVSGRVEHRKTSAGSHRPSYVLDEVSSHEGEPGYRAFCIACGDGGVIKVSVDGVDVSRRCDAADAPRGWARCYVETPDGNIAHNGHGDILTELVRGLVVITVT